MKKIIFAFLFIIVVTLAYSSEKTSQLPHKFSFISHFNPAFSLNLTDYSDDSSNSNKIGGFYAMGTIGAILTGLGGIGIIVSLALLVYLATITITLGLTSAFLTIITLGLISTSSSYDEYRINLIFYCAMITLSISLVALVIGIVLTAVGFGIANNLKKKKANVFIDIDKNNYNPAFGIAIKI